MTHEQKGEIILFGIVLVFVVLFLISICLFIYDIKQKYDTTKSKETIFLSAIGIIVLLIAHWYWS